MYEYIHICLYREVILRSGWYLYVCLLGLHIVHWYIIDEVVRFDLYTFDLVVEARREWLS